MNRLDTMTDPSLVEFIFLVKYATFAFPYGLDKVLSSNNIKLYNGYDNKGAKILKLIILTFLVVTIYYFNKKVADSKERIFT